MSVASLWMLPGRVLRWWWLRAGTYGPTQSRQRKACREGGGCADWQPGHGVVMARAVAVSRGDRFTRDGLTGAADRARLDSGFD